MLQLYYKKDFLIFQKTLQGVKNEKENLYKIDGSDCVTSTLLLELVEIKTKPLKSVACKTSQSSFQSSFF